MKKQLITLTIIAVMLVTVLSACNNEPSESPITQPSTPITSDLLPFSVTITQGSASAAFTNADLASLTLKEFAVEALDGETIETSYYKGVSFSDVFALKGIALSGNPIYTFTSILPKPDGAPYIQTDNTYCPLDTYYFGLYLKNSSGEYKPYNTTVKNSADEKVAASGIRNICTSPNNYKAYWVKGLAAIDITYETHGE